jgi:hypothetical protein
MLPPAAETAKPPLSSPAAGALAYQGFTCITGTAALLLLLLLL